MKKSSGQVVLVTLLVLTVVMSIAIALIGRTRTDVTSTAEVEESARAFSAAEAGIEEALQGSPVGGGAPKTLSGVDASYTTNTSSIGAAETGIYAFPQLTQNGETETLWFVRHNPGNQNLEEASVYKDKTIKVCWKKMGDGEAYPALVVSVLYKRGSNYLNAKAAYDSVTLNGKDNSFTYIGGLQDGACGQNGVLATTVDFSPFLQNNDILLAMRLRPIYSDAFLYVDAGPQTGGNNTLVDQGNMITSTGTTANGISRRVVVSQQYKSAPSIFDMAVLSQDSFSR